MFHNEAVTGVNDVNFSKNTITTTIKLTLKKNFLWHKKVTVRVKKPEPKLMLTPNHSRIDNGCYKNIKNTAVAIFIQDLIMTYKAQQ